MSQISVTDLTFAYDGTYENVFEGATFQLDTAWKLGFVGRNGRGKTTFLRLLKGELTYSGRISKVNCDYFPPEISDKSLKTIEILEQFPGFVQWRLEGELRALKVGLDVLDRPFSTLSNGEQTKVCLAGLFLQDDNFLLIDEPTNHLDTQGRQLVSRYLKGKSGFILVSHDRAFLDDCVDHILSINKAKIDVQKGNFSSWWHNKQLEDAYEQGQNEKLASRVKHLAQGAQRTAGWPDQVEKTKYDTKNAGLRPDRGYIGHKSAKMMKRSKAIDTRRQEALADKEKLLKNIEYTSPLELKPLTHHSKTLVFGRDLSLFYGQKVVCSGVNIQVNQGDRLGIVGKNGSGKTSLLNLLQGAQIDHSGTLELASGLVISYVPQETEFLQGSLTDFALSKGVDESRFKTILRKLDFSRSQLEKPMESLSQGQKKKVVIAASLCQSAHLYLWDEPLNYIDVLSRIQIEQLICHSNSTLILVEHDRTFIDHIGAKLLCLG